MRGKRIKQFILILCMVCLFGMNVQAEDVYTEFHVDNQKGKAGDVVTVPVEFNTGQEVGGFLFIMTKKFWNFSRWRQEI